MDYTEKVIQQSNYWYNDGLHRTNIRDLSGAIVSLRRSIQYSRENVQARNLLGLVYYGRGEINEALVEWILSKNLKPRDNVANYFIRKIQDSNRELAHINDNIKKYNQCLAYCHQQAEDLALIQLKQVVKEHPDFVKAQQLLALLCIRKGQYNRAVQALKKARKIDNTDSITLYYINELEDLKGKRGKEDTEDAITYMVGNETIIQPVSPTLKENAGTSVVLNIVTGVVIGAAVVAFLIRPMLSQKDALLNAEAIRTYSSQIDTQTAQINALKTELDEYRTLVDSAEMDSTTAQETVEAYEVILQVNEEYASQEVSNASMAEKLLGIEEDALDTLGMDIYKKLIKEIYPPLNERYYSDAKDSFDNQSYENAIKSLLHIMELTPSYDDYQAMLMLAQSYNETDHKEEATTYYERIVAEGGSKDAVAVASEALGLDEESQEQ